MHHLHACPIVPYLEPHELGGGLGKSPMPLMFGPPLRVCGTCKHTRVDEQQHAVKFCYSSECAGAMGCCDVTLPRLEDDDEEDEDDADRWLQCLSAKTMAAATRT